MKKQGIITLIIVSIAVALFLIFGLIKKQSSLSMEPTNTIIMNTSAGDITLELYGGATPKTVENFITLAKDGYYDGTRFHRVIENFMIQGGDPLSKDEDQKDAWGQGGPGYQFEDEFVDGLSNVAGTLSMANAGPGTNGSQFFINVADNTFLDGKHTVFGKVTEGYDIVEALSQVATDERDRPIEDVVLNSVTIQ
ncbi:peptidylprolyl isomerase [Candidatus Nomurabacteria bacterium]|nr:peptidylprolyl isomerase [Candidatus Nomurabacteria bacterium]